MAYCWSQVLGQFWCNYPLRYSLHHLVRSLCTCCVQGGHHDHGWGIQRRNAIFRSLFDGLNDSMNNSIRSFALDWHFDDKENSSHLSNLDSSPHAGYTEVLRALPRHPSQVRLQDDATALRPLFTPEPRFNQARPQEAITNSASFFVDNASHIEESEERSEVSEYFVGFGLEQEQSQIQNGMGQITGRHRSDLPLGEVSSQLPGSRNGRTHENRAVENRGQSGSVYIGQQSGEGIRVHTSHNGGGYSNVSSGGSAIQQTTRHFGALALLPPRHQ